MEQQEINEMVKKAYVQEVTRRTQGAMDILKNLRETAAMLGPETVQEVETDLARRVPVTEIQRKLMDKMGITKAKAGQRPEALEFKDIDDADFYAAIANPTKRADDPGAGPSAEIRSFKQIDEEAFFAGLKQGG
jgi:hypothetical protein